MRSSKEAKENQDTFDEEFQALCEGVDPVKSPEPHECVESSQLSQSHWKKSLRNGCLNKCLNDKSKLFSYVRHLTRQTNLPLGSIPVSVEDKHQTKSSSSEKTDDGHDKKVTSIIIIEDVSRPPEASEEAVQLSFTDDELFSFLSSTEWGGSKRVRLISGNFLQRMLTSLYVLEAKGIIFTRCARTYLNNGYWKIPQKEVVEELSYETPLDTAETKEWINEKILVDMVYYGKLKTASRTSIESLPKYCKAPPLSIEPDIAKLVVKTPAAYCKYPTDNLKLPPGEDKNPVSKIKRLACEMVTLRDNKEKELLLKQAAAADAGKAKDKKKQDDLNERETKQEKGYDKRVSIEIEDIAEDPYLVPEGSGKIVEATSTPIKKIESIVKLTRPSYKPMVSAVKKESEVAFSTSQSEDSQVKAKESSVRGESEKSVKQFDPENADSIVTVKENLQDVGDSEVETESGIPSGAVSKVPSNVMNYLNLSGNELYVSGLYRERDENAQPIALRLHQANKQRLKQRRETAKLVYDKCYQSREVDLDTRFKRLAETKELERRKAMAPKLPTTKKELVQPQTDEKTWEDPWTRYCNNHEEIEMRAATDKTLEKNVLKRITDKQRAQEDTDKRGKHEKNRNKNRNKHNSFANDDATNNARKTNNPNPGKSSSELRPCLKTNSAKRIRAQMLDQMKDISFNDAIAESGRNCIDALNALRRLTQRKNRFSPTFSNFYKEDERETILFRYECDQSLDKKDNKTRLPPLIRSCPDTVRTQKPRTNKNDKRNHTPRRKPYHRRSVSRDKSNNRLKNKRSTEDWNCNSAEQINEVSGSKTENSNPSGRNTASASEMKEMVSEMNDQLKSSTLATPSPVGPSESEILQQDLARFDAGCNCYECGSDDLDDLRPGCRNLPFLYPVKLGRLKRSFHYLENLKECRALSSTWEVSRYHQGMGDEFLRDEILGLLDKMVIRKEILASSLGNTFTTIVFIK